MSWAIEMKTEIVIIGIALTCASCATDQRFAPDVAELAAQLSGDWNDRCVEHIFMQGTNGLSRLWMLEQTQGFSDTVYDRARQVARLLESQGNLRLVDEDELFSGTLPVSNADLEKAIGLAMPLLIPKEHEGEWQVDKIIMTQDNTRALVRCHALLAPLDGKGWFLVFARTRGEWTLVVIQQQWVS